MPYTDNPVKDFLEHDREQAKQVEKLPVCDCCDEPIQADHYYLINSDNICPDCLDNYYRKDVDIE